MKTEYKKVKLKNGEIRYVFDVSLGTVSGKRKRTTIRAKTVKEGRQKVAELQLGNRQIIERSDRYTVDDAYNLYLTEKKKSQAPKTFYETKLIQKRINFGSVRLSALNERDVREWLNGLKISENTRRSYYYRVRAFLDWCVSKDMIMSNPLPKYNKRVDVSEMSFLTESEFWNMYRYLKHDRHRIALITLMYTGLRKSELCGLSAGDLHGCELHLSHTCKRTNVTIITDEFKNKQSKRIVPIPRWLKYDLERFLKTDDYPFMTLYQTISLELNKALDQAGMERIRVHDLRHSYVSMLISKGVDLFTIAKLIGHSSTRTTERIYSHLYDETRRKITDLL